MSGGRDWTAAEIAQVDRMVRTGTPPSQCLERFPERSQRALDTFFAVRRRALGVTAARGRPGRPRSEKATSTEIRSQHAFEAAAAAGSRRLLDRQLETGQFFAAARAVWLAARG